MNDQHILLLSQNCVHGVYWVTGLEHILTGRVKAIKVSILLWEIRSIVLIKSIISACWWGKQLWYLRMLVGVNGCGTCACWWGERLWYLRMLVG